MKRGPIMLAVGGVAALAVVLLVRGWADRGRAYRPGDTFDGRHSGITTPEYHLVTGEAQWSDLWNRHRPAGDRGLEGDTLPDVDFRRHMVVAIFLGESSQCTGITFRGVDGREGDNGLDVHFRPDWYSAEYDPEEEASTSAAEHAATPFGFIVVPRAAKVRLFEDVQSLRDADPAYEPRAELSRETPVVSSAPRAE